MFVQKKKKKKKKKKKDCEYSLEPRGGGSNENPQSMF